MEHCDTAGEFCETLMKFFFVIVAGCGLDLSLYLSDTLCDSLF